MSVVVLIGRILFSYLFITSAFAHFTQTTGMAGYAASKGVPAARLATMVSGLMIGIGGLMLLFGIWADLGALLIAAFTASTAVLIHGFWKASPEEKMMETVQFNKDLALCGAALIMFGLISIAGDDLGLTITGPLFN
jgi:putative oxidoreductase